MARLEAVSLHEGSGSTAWPTAAQPARTTSCASAAKAARVLRRTLPLRPLVISRRRFAQHLTGIDEIRTLQHWLVRLEDLVVLVRIAVVLLGDLRQVVAFD